MSRYVVVDLEMCRVPKCYSSEYSNVNETIQIGAVLLDDDFNITDEFETFVAPVYGVLDRKISKLTGIVDEDLQGAPLMDEALNMFADWLPDEETVFVQWSNADKHQLQKEMAQKGLSNARVEALLEQCEDCQALFKERVEAGRVYSLKDAVNAAGIDAVGREHNALYDAYNTALLYKKLRTEPDLKLHPLYESARDEKVEHLGYSIGSLLSGFDFSALPA